MTLGQWLDSASQRLAKSGIKSARLDAQLIAERVLSASRIQLAARRDEPLGLPAKRQLESLLTQRQDRIPLAYILENKEFYGLDFKITRAVLVPRPESEALVDAAIEFTPRGGTVLDMGTGSGCIAVSLKFHRPDLDISAVDISLRALNLAKANARQHNQSVKFQLSDLFDSVEGKFDLILANLPYVPVEARRQPELNFEPGIALYSGQDGLDHYRRFMAQAKRYLTKGGQITLEVGPSQRRIVANMATKQGLRLTDSLSEYVHRFQAVN